jgi:hypothetical protein
MNSRPSEPFTINAAGHHSELVGPADGTIEMILPFRLCQSDQPMGDSTQHSFNLEKQPRLEWAEVSVEHMAVRRMHHHRHLGNPSRNTTKDTSFRCVGMDH